jgi:hypothetical protein
MHFRNRMNSLIADFYGDTAEIGTGQNGLLLVVCSNLVSGEVCCRAAQAGRGSAPERLDNTDDVQRCACIPRDAGCQRQDGLRQIGSIEGHEQITKCPDRPLHP